MLALELRRGEFMIYAAKLRLLARQEFEIYATLLAEKERALMFSTLISGDSRVRYFSLACVLH